MNPLDPAEYSSEGRGKQNLPDFIDEDPQLESVREGLDMAEDEVRQAAMLAVPEGENETVQEYAEPRAEDELAPEEAAMHEEFIPVDDDER